MVLLSLLLLVRSRVVEGDQLSIGPRTPHFCSFQYFGKHKSTGKENGAISQREYMPNILDRPYSFG